MEKRGKKSNIFITAMIIIAVVAIAFILKYRSKAIKSQNNRDQDTIEQLKQDIENEKDRAEELEQYSKYVKTKQFVELMARNKLGLVYPNEIILKPID